MDTIKLFNTLHTIAVIFFVALSLALFVITELFPKPYNKKTDICHDISVFNLSSSY